MCGLAGSAPTAAVGPAARLPCGARTPGSPGNSLRSLRSLRSDTPGLKSDVDARRARRPGVLRSSAPQSRCADQPARAFAAPLVVFASNRITLGSRQVVPGGGELVATRSAGLRSARAQRALPPLTCRICLSAVSAANVASYAARPQTEHRSGVGAQRRPPQPGPSPGTACRATRRARIDELPASVAAKARAGWLAQRLCGAEERRTPGRRAQRASPSDFKPGVFERSERSERSELPGGPGVRAPQGSRAAGPTAAVGAEPASPRAPSSLAGTRTSSSTLTPASAATGTSGTRSRA